MENEMKLYICDTYDCIGSVLTSLPYDFTGMTCMACKEGKYVLWEVPKYVGCLIEGQTEYLHKIK